MTYGKEHKVVVQAYGSLGNPPLDPRDPGIDPLILHGAIPTKIAQAHNRSTVQVALKWIVHKGIPAVTKSGNPIHLAEDLDLWSFNLTDDDIATLDAMSKPGGSPSFACNDHSIGTGTSELLV